MTAGSIWQRARARLAGAFGSERAIRPVPTVAAAEPQPPAPPAGWWDLLPFRTHRIRLADGLETMVDGVDPLDDVRTDAVVAACGGDLSGRSVVDLGCNEGGFTLAFAQLGAARSVGIEARRANVERADLARRLLRLEQVECVEGDVKHELDRLGPFDVVFASGILYHIADPLGLLRSIRRACSHVALIDTHVASEDNVTHGCSELVERAFDGDTYRGRMYHEYDAETDDSDRQAMLWTAWSDEDAFWPTEPDLVRMLGNAGFTSVERLDPVADGNERRWGVDPRNRVLYLVFA